jgi:biopolymer transport protein ExbB/TolQ
MNEENSLGFAHFLAESDMLGRIVLLLPGLSVARWYLVVTKALANYQAGRRAEAFLIYLFRRTQSRFGMNKDKIIQTAIRSSSSNRPKHAPPPCLGHPSNSTL